MVTRTKKIFVGGLSVNTTVEDVKHYFEQFGKVGLSLRVVLCRAELGKPQNIDQEEQAGGWQSDHPRYCEWQRRAWLSCR